MMQLRNFKYCAMCMHKLNAGASNLASTGQKAPKNP